MDSECGSGRGGLVEEWGTEMSSETEIRRSSQDSLTHMEAESMDLSPLNQSMLQANDELTVLKPREELLGCLKCWYTNATSLNQDKLDELRVMCADAGPDIIFISETWFNSGSIIHIEGYECFRRDRGDGNGGGVCIYGKNSSSLIFRVLDYEQFRVKGIEQVWLAVDTGVESILLGCIYRPEFLKRNGVVCDRVVHKKRDDEINKSINLAGSLVNGKKKFQGVILAGDLNYNEIEWDQSLVPVVTKLSEPADEFIRTLNSSFLTQHVYFKTFQKKHRELTYMTNTLDLVITDGRERIVAMEQGRLLGDAESGHVSISWSYQLAAVTKKGSKQKEFNSIKYNYIKGDYKGMRAHLKEIDWEERFTGANVQEQYDIFMKEYENSCNKFLKEVRVIGNRKERPPWMSKDLKVLVRRKANLWRKHTTSGKLGSLDEYKTCAKAVKKGVKEAIKSYEMEIISKAKDNPKLLYAYINNRQQAKESIRSLRTDNGENITDRKEIATILNSQFKSVFTVDDDEEMPEFKVRTSEVLNGDGIKMFERSLIEGRLDKLDGTKAMGRDKVSSMVLKSCSDEWARALQIIYSKSYDEGIVPSQWGMANITPVFKTGNKLDAVNYRPVSLTSVCCKIMEGIVRDEMMQYFYDNNLISKQQHGFVRRRACVTNLLECQNLVSKSMLEGNTVDVLYTDFSKAFDKVSHRKLIHKLKAYGVQGKMLGWVEAFLRRRKQCVVLGDVESSWEEVTSSVPQGSVLGPFLFVVYINDLPDSLNNVCKMYADDNKVIAVNRWGVENKLQEDINNTVEWCRVWSMKLNGAKCKLMYFGKDNPKKEYVIEENGRKMILKETETEKDLGVIITTDGKCSAQVEAGVNKASWMLGRLRKTFRYFDLNLCKKLYPTFVRPHLEFASSVWNTLSKKEIRKIEGVQRKATGMVLELRGMEYGDRLKKLGYTDLEMRRKRGDLIQLYKIANGLEEVDLGVKMGRKNIGRSHTHQIVREDCRGCNMRGKFLPNRTATTWNLLPPNVVNSKTVNSFKARLDAHVASGDLRRSVYQV